MDIVGEPGIVAEVELLTAVATFFKRLGVGPDIVGIRVNSRKVLDVALQARDLDIRASPYLLAGAALMAVWKSTSELGRSQDYCGDRPSST